MGISEFRGPGLSDAQWEQIRALADSLDAKQLVWLSGFFAGIDHQIDKARGGAPAEAPSLRVPSRTLTVLYGSETGNSATLAKSLVAQFEARGRSARVVDMGAYKLRELKDEQDILIVTSTYGEGDPPQPAIGFFEFVEGAKAPKLAGVRFAVLALGDSTYKYFCEAGKRLDTRFEKLGATRLTSRVDCDVDYDEAAANWSADVIALLAANDTPAATSIVDASTPPQNAVVFDKRHPFSARIIENISLTGRGSSKETRHVEFSLEGSGLSYEPGDALGILPQNDPKVVEGILSTLGLDGSASLKVKEAPTTLRDALTHQFEIAAVTPRFIEHWATLSGSEKLRSLVADEQGSDRADFMHQHHIIDVLRQYPVKDMEAAQLVPALRPLQPRLYSIASSFAAAPDEVHLTVSTVNYELFGEPRNGVASGQIAHRADVGSALPVYVQSSPHFRLPADDVPIIMIGAGTGVAPYRAFMQEREIRGAKGRSWLFFGERNFRTDFLYQLEWQSWLKDGTLSRMDVAFSRDRASLTGGKTYVQHRLKEQAKDLFAWLEEGAHIYVCGDANNLAPGVNDILKTIVATQGGLSAVETDEYLARLREEHRYKLDVY
jgi:sulfite reductase (NADPH) flavoprotein alpha-component